MGPQTVFFVIVTIVQAFKLCTLTKQCGLTFSRASGAPVLCYIFQVLPQL